MKLDFIAGLLLKALEVTGTADFRGIQTTLRRGPGLAQPVLGPDGRDGLNPVPWKDGAVLPNLSTAWPTAGS